MFLWQFVCGYEYQYRKLLLLKVPFNKSATSLLGLEIEHMEFTMKLVSASRLDLLVIIF